MFRASTSALAAASDTPPPATAADDSEFDTVTDEIARYKVLPDVRVDHFRDDVGILNEFALMYDLKDSFPLHYVVFRQVACHLPHEANTESIFSLAGKLSDPRMDINYLSDLVYMMANKKLDKPDKSMIKKSYLTSFSKNGKLEEASHGPEGFDEDEKMLEACAALPARKYFAYNLHMTEPSDHLPLRMTPQSPLFSRTPSPTGSPSSPWSYSKL